MKVELLDIINEGAIAAHIAVAGKICYADNGYSSIDISDSDANIKFVDMIQKSGHLSVLEHVSFTFLVEDISRVATHQLVRHRIASYSQQSQRYTTVNSGGPGIVNHNNCMVPLKIAESPFSQQYRALVDLNMKMYSDMIEAGIPKEDARYILPSGMFSNITVTMNMRALIEFLSKRLCSRAQSEMRILADLMLDKLTRAYPNLFRSIGPSCLNGKCGEGKFTCGRPWSKKANRGVYSEKR